MIYCIENQLLKVRITVGSYMALNPERTCVQRTFQAHHRYAPVDLSNTSTCHVGFLSNC
jgi:hypothetical protein